MLGPALRTRQGMCVGEKRRLKIPSRLAFGATGSPSYPTVPPNAPVIYDIELLSIGGPPPGPQAPDAPPERVPQAYEDYDDEL